MVLAAGVAPPPTPSQAVAGDHLWYDGVRWTTYNMPYCVGSAVALQADGGTVFCAQLTGASGAPSDATYIVQTANAGLSAEQAMGALGSGLVLNTTTTGVQSIYAGSTCSAGQYANATNASGALTCAAVTGSQVSGAVATADALSSNPTDCGANLYATAIAANGNLTCAGVTGGQVTGAVATATALASNPADCSAGQYATTIAANGDLTCAGVTGGQVTGAVATATALAANPADCGANAFATTIAANGDLTCAQPSFTNLSGSATVAQGAYPWTTVTVANDVTDNTSAGATNITGLTFSPAASTNYRMRCYLVTDAAAATTGVQVGITGPAAATQLTWSRTSCSSAVLSVFASINTFAADARTASAGTTRCLEELNLVLQNGANTTAVQLTVNTEVDTSQVAVRKGSWCEYMTF
jgi:hypothetical protein